jgi:hypothetical protein
VSFTFGRTTTTSYSGSAVAHNKYGGKYPLYTTGVLQSITALVSVDAAGPAPVRYGVYSASTYALIASTVAETVPAGSSAHWRTLSMIAPLNLTAGEYILCEHSGSDNLNIYRDLSGGVSGYVWDEYTGGLANPWGTWDPGTKHYCIYGTLELPNQAPYAPTPTFPIGGQTINGGQSQTFTFTFGDPDPGDTLAAHTTRYRESGTTPWTTCSEVVSPYAQHVFAGGTFPVGKTYEYQIKTKDNHGLEGPYCTSATFYVASPPSAPTITDPVNNQTISTATYDMDWSIADQDAWQGRRVADNAGSPDPGTIYEDTGTVEEASTRTKTWTVTVNNRTEHWQVRARHDGVWGDWGTVKVNIAFTGPEIPTLVVTSVSASGYISLEPTQPTPGSGKPTVIAIDVYRTETSSKDDAIRIAAAIDPEATYYDYQVADCGENGPSYKYYIVAIGDNGSTTESALEG